MELSKEKYVGLATEALELVNKKSRLDRLKIIKIIDELTGNFEKSQKLKRIEGFERTIAERISKHVEKCGSREPCNKELAMDMILKMTDIKKREIINQKTLAENVKSNPIGLGILLIGVANIAIAIIQLFRL